MLKQVLFTEGQFVSKGQHLFQIEPAPFEAALTAAKAASENARGNADRLETIVKKGYVTEQDYRNVRAMADQAKRRTGRHRSISLIRTCERRLLDVPAPSP